MAKANNRTSEMPKTKEQIKRLKEIQLELRRNLAELQLKLEIFDSEPDFLISLESAKKDAELKANDLEAEVKRLREELKAIKDLLGTNIEKK